MLCNTVHLGCYAALHNKNLSTCMYLLCLISFCLTSNFHGDWTFSLKS